MPQNDEKNEVKIFKCLIKDGQLYYSIEFLSYVLGVSGQTLRNKIKNQKGFLHKYVLKIKKGSGKFEYYVPDEIINILQNKCLVIDGEVLYYDKSTSELIKLL
ncbi:hypothetical protein ACO3UB_08530 (plasmid) [Methanocaldococcus sp. 16A]